MTLGYRWHCITEMQLKQEYEIVLKKKEENVKCISKHNLSSTWWYTHLSIVMLRHFSSSLWHQLLAQLDVSFSIFFCIFIWILSYGKIDHSERSVGHSQFFLFGIVSAVNQQFSLVSFSICAKIRKVLQMQTERQKSISNPRHANQINMFPFEMRAFCWCYCCLKAKAKSVQQSVVSLSGAGFRFYFFLRNG